MEEKYPRSGNLSVSSLPNLNVVQKVLNSIHFREVVFKRIKNGCFIRGIDITGRV
jgi:hypothetical protein